MKLEHLWYERSPWHPLALLLLPLSFLFFLITGIRRFLYRSGLLKIGYFNPPVIVVGNLTAGGTGKTPFVMALAELLQSQGYKPGIVSRGVGGSKHRGAHLVQLDDTPAIVGDEALMLARRTQCPMVIGRDRAQAVQTLLAQTDCNIVISDDGLQHYGLDRDIEIVMVDQTRGFGNGYLMPAGPLREQKSRLKLVDFVVVNGGDEHSQYAMTVSPVEFVSVANPDRVIPLADFPRKNVHATAAIGNPERFFQTLRSMDFETVQTHVFPDHHLYQSGQLDFADGYRVIMTEKDAVKCKGFADERYWFLRVNAHLNETLSRDLLLKVAGV